VKRTLPRSGAYDLDSYLPEYLWRQLVRRQGGDHFTSFLAIIAEKKLRQDADEERSEFYEDIMEPNHDCLYCGYHMTSAEESRRHIQSDCPDRPKWDHSCLFCGLEFPTELGLIIHTARWCKDKPKKK